MSALERRWAEAVEFSADERAVGSKRQALELASAIVKVAALRLPATESNLIVTNFVGSAASTALRVQKLAEWKGRDPASDTSRAYAFLTFVAVAITVALSYSEVLVVLHSVTELLFR